MRALSDEHWTKRRIRSDDTLRAFYTAKELYAMAEECPIEPADPTICDACAAYLIAQEKEAEPDPSEEEMAFLRGAAAGMSAENDELKAALDRTSTALVAERALADEANDVLSGLHDVSNHDVPAIVQWQARYRKARGL